MRTELSRFFIGYRRKHKLNQVQLGRLLGHERSYICRLENGMIIKKMITIKKFSDNLNLNKNEKISLVTAYNIDNPI